MKYAQNPYVLAADLPLSVRTRDIALTVLVWAAYLYCMRGFFMFLMQATGWAEAGFPDVAAYPMLHDVSTFVTYGFIVLGLAMAFAAWSTYNQLRFGRKNRRRFQKAVGIDELVIAYHNKPRDIAAWQNARIMVMHLDNAARVTKVDIIGTQGQMELAYGS